MSAERQPIPPPLPDSQRRFRAPFVSVLVGLRDEHELSLVRRALEQLMRTTGVGQRHSLGHNRMDLSLTKQLKQRPEVLTEPLRVAGTSTHRKRWTMSAHRKHLVAFTQLLDPVDEDPAPRREHAPERDGGGRRIPLDPPPPALAPVRHGAGVAEHDEPSAGPQRSEGVKRQPAPEPVEHDIHAFAVGQLARPGHEVLSPVVDRHSAEAFNRGEVAS